MKIRILFAILCAAMLGCCAFGGTAYAEETKTLDLTQYQMGDINLDGEVDVEDAQIALIISAHNLAQRAPETYLDSLGITEEQMLLGDVIRDARESADRIDADDAQQILIYYCDKLSGKSTGETIGEYTQRKMDLGLTKVVYVINDWRS